MPAPAATAALEVLENPDTNGTSRTLEYGCDTERRAVIPPIGTGQKYYSPLKGGQLLLGAWQGIYLWGDRTHAHRRRIVVTVLA